VSYEEEVRGWLDLQLVSGRYSSRIVQQLAEMIASRSASVFPIYNEIALLEGAPHARMTGTKQFAPLKGLLAGLHHKHYSQPSYLMKNVVNFLESKNFDSLSRKVLKDPEISENAKLNALVHKATINGYEQRSRSRKLTGEWIVYKRFHQANYYLTLATHTEGDQSILDRVLACRDEFPELALDKSGPKA
jgi:hypothetical protein